MSTNKGYLFRAFRGVSYHHFLFWQKRQAEKRDKFIVEKREGFRHGPNGSCWPGETLGGLIRNEAVQGPYWLGVHIRLSLVGPKLKVSKN